MTEKEKELEAIIDALSYCDFQELTEDVFFTNVIYPFKEHYKKAFYDNQGASKGVLIFPNFNFVIKFPFVGNGGVHFCCADGDSQWDYCEVEVSRYKEAEKDCLTDCFAKTELLTIIDNFPIYIQEYATIFNSYDLSDSTTSSREEQQRADALCEEKACECFNEIWLGDVFHFFGEKTLYNLLDFILKIGISDLHDGNLGYIGQRPVLVDYSSFDD